MRGVPAAFKAWANIVTSSKPCPPVPGTKALGITGVKLDPIDCPLCGSPKGRKRGDENGSDARCVRCKLVYVTSRPAGSKLSGIEFMLPKVHRAKPSLVLEP